MQLSHYRKLITVIVGLAVMLAARYGFDLSTQADMVVDTVVSVLTAFGVFQVVNVPKEVA
jgi:uncharacterized membrane protein